MIAHLSANHVIAVDIITWSAGIKSCHLLAWCCMLTDIGAIVCHQAWFLKCGRLCLFLLKKPHVSCPFGSLLRSGSVAWTERDTRFFQLLFQLLWILCQCYWALLLSVSDRFPLGH